MWRLGVNILAVIGVLMHIVAVSRPMPAVGVSGTSATFAIAASASDQTVRAELAAALGLSAVPICRAMPHDGGGSGQAPGHSTSHCLSCVCVEVGWTFPSLASIVEPVVISAPASYMVVRDQRSDVLRKLRPPARAPPLLS